MVVVFYFGSLKDLEAETGEDCLDLLAEDRQRMAVAQRHLSAGQGDIDRTGGLADGGEFFAARRQRPSDVLLERVGIPPQRRPLVCRRRGDRLEQCRDRTPLAAEVAVTKVLEAALAGGLLKLGEKVFPELVDVGGGGFAHGAGTLACRPRLFGLGRQMRERVGFARGQLREGLAVETDTSRLEAVHELAVAQAVLPRRRVDPDYP